MIEISLAFGAGMLSAALLVTGVMLILAGRDKTGERIDAACTLIESSAFGTSEAYKLGVSEGMADGWQQANGDPDADDLAGTGF